MKNEIIIRAMQKKDIAGISRLLFQLDELISSGHRVSADVIHATHSVMWKNKNTYRNYVAVQKNTIIGFISAVVYKTFFHPGGTVLINELIVDGQFRDKGIGERLKKKY